MNQVRTFPSEIAKLKQEFSVAEGLGREAEVVRGRVRAPAKMEVFTRFGIGPRGAFSQVIMRGDGALAVEFGTRRSRAVAPLRRALGGSGF